MKVQYDDPRSLDYQKQFDDLVTKKGARGAAVRDLANKFYVTCRRRNPKDSEHCPFPYYLAEAYERGSEIRN
jgi:hypothetical protein